MLYYMLMVGESKPSGQHALLYLKVVHENYMHMLCQSGLLVVRNTWSVDNNHEEASMYKDA